MMIGGSSLINIGIGIVRTKAMALFLGPAGVGLAGLYGSIVDVTVSVAGMGVNSSGVRQIAEAAGSEDTERISRTAAVLRNISVALGVIGAVLLVAFSTQISQLTFGTAEHIGAICLLSVAVLLRLISDGQGALIQGMRRIADLARISVFGALAGTLFGIPLVYVLREDGVAPAIVTVAASTLLTSWWYRRGIHIPHSPMSRSEARHEASSLLKLGAAFMASSLLTMGSAYAIRLMIMRRMGAEATGLYQSAWTLGGLYVGFILQAMGADFYPRLTASANDNGMCNRLVNEQARVGLLLAGPGVIATLTVAPLIMALFYTADFNRAVPILRWICLGMTLRVVSWPMGFILLAKGCRNLFFWSDVAWTVVHAGLVLISLSAFGVTGAGIAFFGSYIFHGCLVYGLVRRLSSFRWTKENLRAGILFSSLICVVFLAVSLLPHAWGLSAGAIAVLVAASYSARTLLKLSATNVTRCPILR
jgi:PST family polysaccharide transporter